MADAGIGAVRYAAERMAEQMGHIAELEAENARLREALREMVYETTHLSPLEDDGSHRCRISKEALARARAALAHSGDA